MTLDLKYTCLKKPEIGPLLLSLTWLLPLPQVLLTFTSKLKTESALGIDRTYTE